MCSIIHVQLNKNNNSNVVQIPKVLLELTMVTVKGMHFISQSKCDNRSLILKAILVLSKATLRKINHKDDVCVSFDYARASRKQ